MLQYFDISLRPKLARFHAMPAVQLERTHFIEKKIEERFCHSGNAQ